MKLPDKAPKAKASALLGTTLLVALLAAIGLAELFGEILESVGDRDGVAAWDRPVLDWAMAARTPSFTAFVAGTRTRAGRSGSPSSPASWWPSSAGAGATSPRWC
ncbi:hypothetical protein GCM10025789_16020 [Tessaracoccus lubricantis]|uniref:Uncharacterized protein n=1 Tax=Tessaracoccus lubricantis TaxID=545543 RepID=A0ABP9FDN8_9ACTN